MIVAGNDIEVIADERLTFTGIAGGIQGGVVAVGASILVVNIESNVQAVVEAGVSLTATNGHVWVKANYTEDIVGVAFTGGGGVVAVGAQVVVINTNAAQTASIVSGSIPRADGGVEVAADADRELFMVTVGIAVGLAAAGAGIGTATLEGDTTANVGAIPVGSVAHPVDHFDVTAESDIDASSLAISVQGGGLALSAAVALVTILGITSATSGASGSVGGGGITISANGDHSADIDAINIAIGAFALGATVAIATNDRSVLATMSASAAMATTGAVLVAADSHDTATAFTPGGGGGGITI